MENLRAFFLWKKALSHWLHRYGSVQCEYVSSNGNLSYFSLGMLLVNAFIPVCALIWQLRLFFGEKSFITVTALIWLLPSVSPQMHSRALFCVILVFSIHAHLTFEVPFLWESFITLPALIRFFSSMCSHVTIENIFLWERFITFDYIWVVIPSVYSHLEIQVIFLSE